MNVYEFSSNFSGYSFPSIVIIPSFISAAETGSIVSVIFDQSSVFFVSAEKKIASYEPLMSDVVTADAAIEMLKTHKLFNQLSFHTVKVIPLLKFTESIEV